MALTQKTTIFLLLLLGLLFILTTGCIGDRQSVNESPMNFTTALPSSVSSIAPVFTTSVQGNLSENKFIAQSEEIILKFANLSDQSLTFKGIKNESYADLYEFDVGNSSFWVNNVTSRVQSASWFEVGSKTQKEIIDLDQGSKIAESYAKGKYPELWNVTDKRGIKQTIKKINDRGSDRIFEYSWQEILYNPDKKTSLQSEMPGKKSVSITINPYTGHITMYEEWYQKSESLLNITPTLSEEQARTYAGIYFKNTGISDFQPTDMKSYGLRIITDNEKNQRLTWNFELIRKSKIGYDEGGVVGIDVYDGRVVWHASIG